MYLKYSRNSSSVWNIYLSIPTNFVEHRKKFLRSMIRLDWNLIIGSIITIPVIVVLNSSFWLNHRQILAIVVIVIITTIVVVAPFLTMYSPLAWRGSAQVCVCKFKWRELAVWLVWVPRRWMQRRLILCCITMSVPKESRLTEWASKIVMMMSSSMLAIIVVISDMLLSPLREDIGENLKRLIVILIAVVIIISGVLLYFFSR